MSNSPVDIREKLIKLRSRIKNTSSVRFHSARRVRLNYQLAQLTVVILSLWAIVISYCHATDLATAVHLDSKLLTAAAVILPVFIVVFSLLEGGENYLRSYQLEHNARQLRELADQLFTEAGAEGMDLTKTLKIFGEFSERYSECLERSPVNHDDLDHYYRHYSDSRRASSPAESKWYLSTIGLGWVWFRTQLMRALYVFFWVAPLILFRPIIVH